MAIIFFEQISQEMFRVVSALQHPVKATILLFIRTAPWMIFTVYVLYGESDKGFLVEIMPYWLLSAFTSVILSIYFLKKEVGKFIFFQKINICWIIEGIKSSIPFIMASVSFGLFSVLDKIVLNQIIGEELLGVYYILLSLAVGHYTIVTFSVGIYYGPRVLDAFYNKTEIEFSSIRNKGVRSIIKTSLLLIFPASIGIHIALFFIGKEVYYEYIWIYYLGLVVNMLWILSDIINYDLFIHNQDKTIAWISISSVIILLILLLILTPVLSVYGALLSSAITFMYLIYIRYKYATRSIDDYKILDI